VNRTRPCYSVIYFFHTNLDNAKKKLGDAQKNFASPEIEPVPNRKMQKKEADCRNRTGAVAVKAQDPATRPSRLVVEVPIHYAIYTSGGKVDVIF
jgi:hypothetical protein